MPTLPDLKKHRREVVLGGLLLAVVVTFLYTRAGAPPAGSAGDGAILATEPPGTVTKALSQMATVKLPGVMLDALSGARAPYDPSQRNIFRYGNIPPPPPSPEEVARIEAARRQAEEERVRALAAEQERQRQLAEQAVQQQIQAALPPPPPPPPPRPVPPAITLRVSGVLGSTRNRMAVLYSGEDLILARTGDEVNKQFRILDIGYDWVKIGYVDPQFAEEYQKLRMGP